MKSLKKRIDDKLRALIKNQNKGFSQKYANIIGKHLEKVLSGIFGYYALLYSIKAKDLVDKNVIVKNSVILSNRIRTGDLVCQYEELPIASDTIDLVVLPEILEQSRYPHQILREVERVLIPEGHIIMIIANPLSWSGLKKLLITGFLSDKSQPRPIGKLRINDWCRLLGLEIINQIPICYSTKTCPSTNKNEEDNLSLLDKVNQLSCEYFSSYYILVAKKKVSTMIPIRPSWRANRKLVKPRFSEPSVNRQVEDCFRQIRG